MKNISSKSQGGIQLPDDVVSIGYRKTGDFEFAQVFRSESNNFEGTEREFIAAGLGYEYRQYGHVRHVIHGRSKGQ